MAQTQRQHYQEALHLLDEMEKGGSSSHASFADRIVRQGFIRKVFGLLAVQLAITTVIGAACVFSAPVKALMTSTPALPTLAFLVGMGIILTFSFSESARSSHPTNLVLLTAFTVAEGVLVGMACMRYPADLVISAFALTVMVSTGLALYAMRTKTDFTAMGGFLYAMLLSLVMCSLLTFWFKVSIANLAIGLVGAALFSAYLVYDIQLILGGDHAHKLSPDDYVMATISIYLDIINLFLHILRILSEMRRD